MLYICFMQFLEDIAMIKFCYVLRFFEQLYVEERLLNVFVNVLKSLDSKNWLNVKLHVFGIFQTLGASLAKNTGQ